METETCGSDVRLAAFPQACSVSAAGLASDSIRRFTSTTFSSMQATPTQGIPSADSRCSEFIGNNRCSLPEIHTESTDNKKLVDDGSTTLSALLRCQALWAADPDATPCMDPWPAKLIDIFHLDLPVKVLRYDDDGDRDVRFRCKTCSVSAGLQCFRSRPCF